MRVGTRDNVRICQGNGIWTRIGNGFVRVWINVGRDASLTIPGKGIEDIGDMRFNGLFHDRQGLLGQIARFLVSAIEGNGGLHLRPCRLGFFAQLRPGFRGLLIIARGFQGWISNGRIWDFILINLLQEQFGRARIIAGDTGPGLKYGIALRGFQTKQAFFAGHVAHLLISIGGAFEKGRRRDGIGFGKESGLQAFGALAAVFFGRG